jgi:Response regulator containing CheY-like receiver, AAA-type ATPase, and DNA-binding domains
VFETTSSSGGAQPPIPLDRGFSIDSVVVGRSPRMRAVFDFVRVIADSESNVLIVGETGTGKEMVANLIHHSGRRRRRPFVAVSCAILTETLIESELFGHERGASLARSRIAPAASRWPREARSSSTISTMCPRRCR